MEKDKNLGLEGFVEKETANKICELFQSKEYEKYNFWTVKGVGRILNTDVNLVSNILSKDARFRKSSFETRDGRFTYALQTHKIGIIEKIYGYINFAADQYHI